MPRDEWHLGGNKPLRRCNALATITGIVNRHERQCLPKNTARLVEVGDRPFGALLHLLALIGVGTGEGPHRADEDFRPQRSCTQRHKCESSKGNPTNLLHHSPPAAQVRLAAGYSARHDGYLTEFSCTNLPRVQTYQVNGSMPITSPFSSNPMSPITVLNCCARNTCATRPAPVVRATSTA